MKTKLRSYWRKIRKNIPEERRNEAAVKVYEYFFKNLKPEDKVLSFFSFGNELSTKKLNYCLANKHQLYLPKIVNSHLLIFKVHSPNDQCSLNKWGIYEPIEASCSQVPLSHVNMIIVPGLAFDSKNHRLGYGKGFYDKLLVNLSSTATTIGLGFSEQFSKEPLPAETHDVSLDSVLFF